MNIYRKKVLEFTEEDGHGIFIANDAITDGHLKVSVHHGNVPCPIGFIFERGKNKCSFAMSKSEARSMIVYLIAEGGI